MASLVYTLGLVVTFICAVLLLRAYVRVRRRLLFWSGLCFVGLTLSNALLVVDLVFVPDVNLYVWRLAAAAAAMLVLLVGLVWESDR
jgi:cytochrome c biogenesis protein CcdA